MMRTKKGVYLLFGVFALLVALPLIISLSKVSFFSDSYLLAGEHNAALLRAELRSQLDTQTQALIARHAAREQFAIQQTEPTTLPYDAEHDRYVVESYGVAYYPSLIAVLRAETPAIQELMQAYTEAFAASRIVRKSLSAYRISDPNNDTAAVRAALQSTYRLTVPAATFTHQVNFGYVDDALAFVYAERPTYVVQRTEHDKKLRQAPTAGEHGRNSLLFGTTDPVRIPSFAEQNTSMLATVYPFFSLLDKRDAAYLCLRAALIDGDLAEQATCAAYSGLTIVHEEEDQFTFKDDTYLFRVDLGCVPGVPAAATEQRTTEFTTLLDAVTAGLPKLVGQSAVAILPGQVVSLHVQFRDDEWLFSTDGSSWHSAPTLTQTSGLSVVQRVVLLRFAGKQFDFVQGITALTDVFTLLDVQTPLTIEPDDAGAAPYDVTIAQMHDVAYLQTVFTDTSFAEALQAHALLVAQHERAKETLDDFLRAGFVCYLPDGAFAETDPFWQEHMLAFDELHYPDAFAAMDAEGNADEQVTYAELRQYYAKYTHRERVYDIKREYHLVPMLRVYTSLTDAQQMWLADGTNRRALFAELYAPYADLPEIERPSFWFNGDETELMSLYNILGALDAVDRSSWPDAFLAIV